MLAMPNGRSFSDEEGGSGVVVVLRCLLPYYNKRRSRACKNNIINKIKIHVPKVERKQGGSSLR